MICCFRKAIVDRESSVPVRAWRSGGRPMPLFSGADRGAETRGYAEAAEVSYIKERAVERPSPGFQTRRPVGPRG